MDQQWIGQSFVFYGLDVKCYWHWCVDNDTHVFVGGMTQIFTGVNGWIGMSREKIRRISFTVMTSRFMNNWEPRRNLHLSSFGLPYKNFKTRLSVTKSKLEPKLYRCKRSTDQTAAKASISDWLQRRSVSVSFLLTCQIFRVDPSVGSLDLVSLQFHILNHCKIIWYEAVDKITQKCFRVTSLTKCQHFVVPQLSI